MASGHSYSANVEWLGNKGSGTSGYRAYGRDHVIMIDGKPDLQGSADPAFRGDQSRHNPEDLLVASLSACHMLWYLHLCADAGIIVTAYKDRAAGHMAAGKDEKIRFQSVRLHPHVLVAEGADKEQATALHHAAHEACFIANSVNFPVLFEPVISDAPD